MAELVNVRTARDQRAVILPDPSNYHPFWRSHLAVGRCLLCALRWDSHWHTLFERKTQSPDDVKRILGVG